MNPSAHPTAQQVALNKIAAAYWSYYINKVSMAMAAKGFKGFDFVFLDHFNLCVRRKETTLCTMHIESFETDPLDIIVSMNVCIHISFDTHKFSTKNPEDLALRFIGILTRVKQVAHTADILTLLSKSYPLGIMSVGMNLLVWAGTTEDYRPDSLVWDY